MKMTRDYKDKYRGKQFYNEQILVGISEKVKLHDEVRNPLSSAASCLNVFGYLNQNHKKIIPFFKSVGIDIDEIIPFPSGANVGGEIYDDQGPIIFEYIGPKLSPINEKGGSRGQNRTSVDGYFLAKIHGNITQVFVEWKFTETYSSGKMLHNFGGQKGVERLRRYSSVLAEMRKTGFPFRFLQEDTIGIQDFSYEPLYQLMRMTLLAKATTPLVVGGLEVEDYRIVHLVHSENNGLLTVQPKHLRFSPGIYKEEPQDIHDIWISLLTDEEQEKFNFGYWNKALEALADLTNYFVERYQ